MHFLRTAYALYKYLFDIILHAMTYFVLQVHQVFQRQNHTYGASRAGHEFGW